MVENPPKQVGPLRLWATLMAASAHGQMSYRASFVLTLLGRVLIFGLEFFALACLFHRFGSLEDWRLEEIAILYGFVQTSVSLALLTSEAFDDFGSWLKSGDLDRVLLRPRDPVLLLAASRFSARRVGRVLQGSLVGLWGLSHLPEFPFSSLGVVLLGLIGGTSVFYGVLLLQASLTFWTTESLEAANILTYGGVETAQVPIHIYPRGIQFLFLAVVPVALCNYYPALCLLGRPDPLGLPPELFPWTPLAGPVFLFLSVQVFRWALKRYRSAGG